MNKYLRFVFGFIFTTSIVFAAPSIEEGKTIFNNRCASCHNVNKQLTGPALAGIDQRRPIDWIIKFVHSPQTVVRSGDTYAIELFNKFNKIPMPGHPDLTDDNIKSIVEYIKSEAKQVSTDKPPFAKPKKIRPAYLPLSLSANSLFFTSFLMLVAFIVVIMYFAVEVKILQRKTDQLNDDSKTIQEEMKH